MSEELRDLLMGRAQDVSVPEGNLHDVLGGGRALRWRKRFYSVGVGVLVGAVAWAGIPDFAGSLRDEKPTKIADTPTPEPEESNGPCDAPFQATYLPDGWSYVLQPGTGTRPDLEPDDQLEGFIGHYQPISEKPLTSYIDLMVRGTYYTLPPNNGGPAHMLVVMDDKARLGRVEDGWTVEFEYDGCEYSLMTFSESESELRRVAASLRPTDSCDSAEVFGPDARIDDGRHFVYITGVKLVGQGVGIQYDRAEFLTGPEADTAAVAAGAIEDGESVPNDYFIVNQSEHTAATGFADDVEVFIETTSQDGQPGLAPADTSLLACDVSDNGPSAYWITVRDQEVVKIEEQYLP